jgi:hypothetical protein
VIGSASAVGRSAQSENDDADWAAGCAKHRVVGGNNAIGIVNQILGIL